MPQDPPSERFDRFDKEAASGSPGAHDGVQPCAAHEPRVRLRIALRDWDFALRKQAVYRLEVAGETFRGAVGESGVVDHLVPESAKTARLTVWPEKAEGVEPEVWELELGALQPLELEPGVQGRLENLLLDAGAEDESGAERRAAALEELQSLFKLDPTRKLDAATKQKLGAVYDSDEAAEVPEPEAWIAEPLPPPPSRR